MKKCPFCKGQAGYTMFDGQHFVQCQKCGAATRGCVSRKEAKAAWQLRAEGEKGKQ